MPAPSPFSMKAVNSSALEGCNSVLDKAALIQRVGMDKNLHIHVIGDGKTAIDCGRGSAPVFVKLEAARARLDLLDKPWRRACIALAEKAEIHGKSIGSLQHPTNMPWSRRAS